MDINTYLLFPLIAAVGYAAAALLLKRAERGGISGVHIPVLANVAMVVAFAAVYPWRDFPALPAVWWPVVLAGLLFAGGQVMTVLAFVKGEVSIATPALGSKVVMVAVIAALFTPQAVSPQTWVAAFAMLAGLWLLVGRPAAADRRRVAAAVFFSLGGALGYGAFDVVVQVWSPVLGFGVLLPISMLLATAVSLPLLLLVRRRPPRLSGGTRRLLLLGVALFSAQAMLFIWSIARFGDAPAANVVYASRGVWSVVLVQMLPFWLAHVERFESRGVFIRRIAGSVVMLVAVALVMAW